MSLKLNLDVTNRTCQFCGYIFSQKCGLLKHLKNNRCPIQKNYDVSNQTNNDELKGIIISLKKQVKVGTVN